MVVGEPALLFRSGLIWFFTRSSAPAWKWQLAQARMLSLDACMSQNSAFPRTIAAWLSAMNSPRFGGTGTVSAVSELGGTVGRGLVWARTPTMANALT